MKKFVLALILTVPVMADAQTAKNPAEMIADFYQLALIVGGILAVGIVIYAGIKYLMNAGNSGALGDARDQIFQAFLGLILLFGAFIILNTINPSLTVLRMPEFERLPKAEVSGVGSSSTPTQSNDSAKRECGGNVGSNSDVCPGKNEICTQIPYGNAKLWSCVKNDSSATPTQSSSDNCGGKCTLTERCEAGRCMPANLDGR